MNVLCSHFYESGTRDLHGNGDNSNPAESVGFPQGWKLALRESRRDGNKYHGSSMGMEEIVAGYEP